MDNIGHMYYIVYGDGHSIIKEIIPHKCEFVEHIKIFSTKSEKCLGFNLSDDGK